MKKVSISEILISSLLISFLLICSQVAGKTYQVNGLECEMCPPGTHWVANCKKGDMQSVCEDCRPGTYSSTENIANHCEECKKEWECPIGTVFINTCSPTTNNRCDCKKGYYWKQFDGYDGKCYRHRTCKQNEVVIKEGTATEDTKCGPKPTDGEPEADSKEKRYPDSDDLKPPDNSDAKGGTNRMLTVPILLIVCMCGYVIYRMFKRYRPRLVLHDD